MAHLPRLAIGTVQCAADERPLQWGLMEVLKKRCVHVQTFHSQAHFAAYDGSHVTGRKQRHLDSWLMNPEVCQEILAHGAACSDLSIIKGTFCGPTGPTRGGCLETLCEWLDLPAIPVVDVSILDPCNLPDRPKNLSGIFLDGVRDAEDARFWQTNLETLWNAPVVGWLSLPPELRAVVARHPNVTEVPGSLLQHLASRLERQVDVDRLMRIAAQRAFPAVSNRLFKKFHNDQPLTVAIAYDEAFHRYFPDTLELLSAGGAQIKDFSPLRGDRVPAEADVVYIGCGRVERYGPQLSANYCMQESLRSHVRRGGRIYAESGGLAYLARQMVLPNGSEHRMTGVLPIAARFNAKPRPMKPVQITMVRDNWLGSSTTRLRGYLNSSWSISPASERVAGGREMKLIGRHQVIGSRMHLCFAALPQFLQSFFSPVPATSQEVSAAAIT